MLKLVDKSIVSLENVVNMYGTKKIKDSFKKTGKIVANNKKTILSKLERHCEFKELANNRYRIVKVYDNPIPQSYNKLNTGFYQYLAPIVLIKLLKEHDETNKILLPLMDYAQHIDMINDNYKMLKYNQDSEDVQEQLGMEQSFIKDYFEKVDDNIKYYIQRCLEHLEKADVLKWYKIPMVRKKKISVSMNSKNNPVINCAYEDVRATTEEVAYYNQIFEEIRKELDIKSKSECFYGYKAFSFCAKLSEKLKEKDIVYFYDCYEIYYTSLERCNNLLQLFENHDDEGMLIKSFNEKFKEIVNTNAERRHLKDISDETSGGRIYGEENYMENFKTLSDTTIDKDAEKMKIKRTNISGDIMDKLDSDFEIKVIKKCGSRCFEKIL